MPFPTGEQVLAAGVWGLVLLVGFGGVLGAGRLLPRIRWRLAAVLDSATLASRKTEAGLARALWAGPAAGARLAAAALAGLDRGLRATADGAGRLGRWGTRRVRRLHDGRVTRYFAWAVAGALGLAAWAVWR